jgi:flagellar hook-associated protein 2
VTEDIDAVTDGIRQFVDAFNDVIGRIDELTAFDPETMERGLLMGDPTVERIRRQLYSMVSGPVAEATGRYTRLNQVGVTVGGGARLQFDEQRFRDAYSADPESVTALFATDEVGVGARFDSVLESLTDSYEGALARKDDSLQRQSDLLGDRIESMQVLLDAKEQRLLNQFYAMESALAQLQSQQSALANMIYVPPGSVEYGLGTAT